MNKKTKAIRPVKAVFKRFMAARCSVEGEDKVNLFPVLQQQIIAVNKSHFQTHREASELAAQIEVIFIQWPLPWPDGFSLAALSKK